jgi:hypothetical protein
VALTFVAESGKVLIRKFVAWVLAPDVDARADLRLTQIANPLKRAFHSKPVKGFPLTSAQTGTG